MLTHEVFADLALFCASVALYAPLVIKEVNPICYFHGSPLRTGRVGIGLWVSF